ncbi:MAG: SDR family oxidoreductase [Pedosphaera sp.]|nr:SDR family oxidoreductase [Pedosphaera sp.]
MNDTPDDTIPLAWITGAGGLIGSHIARTAAAHAPGWRVRGLTRGDFDLTDFPEVRRQFEADLPELVVHCAAMSDPEACETQLTQTRLVNREATFFLSGLAQDIPMIFFSSDLVFDGRHGNYTEEDEPSPLSVYARCKAEAEALVMANPLHTIVRTSLTAGKSPNGNRGIEEQLRLHWARGDTVKLFADEYRCPIPAEVTARAIWELALAKRPGIYHLAGSERMSRLEIGQLIAAKHPELNPKIEPYSLRDHDGPPRAADTSLDCGKLQQLLSFPLRGLREWLASDTPQPA